jgi:endonuclease III
MPTKAASKKAVQKSAKKLVTNEPATKSAAKPRPSTVASRKQALAPERIKKILDLLAAAYPNAECALIHKDAWQLLVATILSAQCTDARVNIVTPVLFKRFPTPADLAAAPIDEIKEIIRTTGFYNNKAKSIQGAAKKIIADFSGKVPRNMEELLTVPGAARKTANVVLGVAYKLAVGVVVDTHVLRLSRRLELTTETTPEKVEQDLMKIIPQDHWIAFSHELIHHGRNVCIARKPRCVDCTLEKVCNSSDKTWSTH